MKKLISVLIVGAVIGGNVYAAESKDFDGITANDIGTTGITIGDTSPSINGIAASSEYKWPGDGSPADRKLTTQGYVDQQINGVQNRINEVERNANAGIAGVAAMSQIQVAPGKDFAIGAGVGTYRGQSALAIGAAARINENLHFRAGFSSSGVIAAGATYSW